MHVHACICALMCICVFVYSKVLGAGFWTSIAIAGTWKFQPHIGNELHRRTYVACVLALRWVQVCYACWFFVVMCIVLPLSSSLASCAAARRPKPEFSITRRHTYIFLYEFTKKHIFWFRRRTKSEVRLHLIFSKNSENCIDQYLRFKYELRSGTNVSWAWNPNQSSILISPEPWQFLASK